MSGFLSSSVYVGFLVSCDCYVAILHGAVGWSAVFDCGISWSYSFAFFARMDAVLDRNNTHRYVDVTKLSVNFDFPLSCPITGKSL